MSITRVALVVPLLLGFASFCNADVLTFGPLVSVGEVAVPADYGGFGWGPFWTAIANGSYDAAYGNDYGAPSGAGASPGSDSYLTSDVPFTFEGADVTSWADNDSFAGFSATVITVAGYDADDIKVGEVSMALSPSGYNFLSADFPNVTDLTFLGTGGASNNDFLIDDLTYATSSTPEPRSVVLFAAGLVGLKLRRKLATHR